MPLADLSWTALVLAALICCCGALVQAAVGFGMALFMVPLLLWVGFALPEAVAMVIGAALLQTAYGTWTVRAAIRWREALSFTAIHWLFIPVGVLGMVLLSDRVEGATLKQAVGALILVLLVARVSLRPRPRAELHRGWTVLAAATTGTLAGLVGMPGPPMALYALAHEWDKDRFRGFLWSQFVLGLPVLLALLAWREGVAVLWFTALGLACLPLIGLGAKLGALISQRWERAQLQRAATILMFVIAAWSIVGPLVFAG